MKRRTTLAVVMARGLGTRMRRESPAIALDAAQQAAASLGLKAMIPDSRGRPFLDHCLAALADGGVRRVVLVVAPDHDLIERHYRKQPPTRVRLSYVVQPEPTGTADALRAAEILTGGEDFLVCNADNLYPVEAIAALVQADGAAVAAFGRAALLRESNIAPDRIATFATLTLDAGGMLRGIVEKPAAESAEARAAEWIGMNLWRFDDGIFAACRDVPRSERGERELPQAVALALGRGAVIRAIPLQAGVLDLSSRGDIAAVAERLGLKEAQP